MTDDNAIALARRFGVRARSLVLAEKVMWLRKCGQVSKSIFVPRVRILSRPVRRSSG